MKPIQRIDAIRNIRKKIISYLSICLIVMLGTAGFLATRYMSEGLETQAEAWYEACAFKDVQIISSVGLDDQNLQTIASTPGVSAVEGYHQYEADLYLGENRTPVQALSQTEKISVPQVISGQSPVKDEECLIARDLSQRSHIRVGDRVRLVLTDVSLAEDILKVHEFTVSGIMRHPEFVRQDMTYSVVIPEAAFDHRKTEGLVPGAFIRLERKGDTSIFSQSHKEEMADVNKRLDELAFRLERDGTGRVQDKLTEKIDQKWEKGQNKLAKSEKKINNGEKELARKTREAEAEIRAGEAELEKALARARRKLAKYEKQRDAADKLLKKLNKQVDHGYIDTHGLKKEIDALLKIVAGISTKERLRLIDQLDSRLDALEKAQESEDQKALQKAIRELNKYRHKEDTRKLMEAIKQYTGVNLEKYLDQAGDGTEVETADARSVLKDVKQGYRDILNGKRIVLNKDEVRIAKRYLKWLNSRFRKFSRKLDRKLRQLSSREKAERQKIAEARAKLAATRESTQKQLDKARAKLKEKRQEAEDAYDRAIEKVSAVQGHAALMDRDCNGGFLDLQASIAGARTAGGIFGILFLMLMALVCFTTLTLIIEEQKREVGDTKAFGFRNHEILQKYLVFGVSAAGIGVASGILGAIALAKGMLNTVNETGTYVLDEFTPVITPVSTVLITVGIIAVCSFSVVFACMDLLRSQAILLMKGETLGRIKIRQKSAARARRKRSKTEHQLGTIYSRLMLRNLRDDRARVALTIVIIGVSCFIIGIGFNMRNVVLQMPDAELTEVYQYDLSVNLRQDVSSNQRVQMQRYLEERDVSYEMATYEPHLIRLDDRCIPVHVLSADKAQIGKIIRLKNPDNGEKVTLSDDGLLLHNRLMETKEIAPGDALDIYTTDLVLKRARVAGEYANYQGRLLIMSEKYYEDIFGQNPEDNIIYLKCGEKEQKEIQQGLLAISGDISFDRADSFRFMFDSLSGVYNAVLVVMIGIAVLMSFMILMNLTNIFVSQKRREIIVMRINGYSRKQTTGYLRRETRFMMLAGLAMAILMGVIGTVPIVHVQEQPDVMFVRESNYLLWAIAVLMEAVFAVVVNSICFRKVKTYQLREINES